MQRHVEQDEPEEDEMALLMANEQWSEMARADADAVRTAAEEVEERRSNPAEAAAPVVDSETTIGEAAEANGGVGDDQDG